MKAAELVQQDMFPSPRPDPEAIIERAMAYAPCKIYALYSGGDDSLVTTDWAVKRIPGCEVLNIDTGIGLNVTRQHIRETSALYGWKLTELRAREDCGQDYEHIVLKHGFPGPSGHQFMYARLKERAVELAVRRAKAAVPKGQKRRAKVMLITGIRHDESQRRAGYGGREINFKGAQMWVNPMYWVGASDFHQYRIQHNLSRGPASKMLGMSGECLCGAYASPGELAAIRVLEPETADYIEDLQRRVRAAGHSWGWEEAPPQEKIDPNAPDLFRPLCDDCIKRDPRLAA